MLAGELCASLGGRGACGLATAAIVSVGRERYIYYLLARYPLGQSWCVMICAMQAGNAWVPSKNTAVE